MIELNCSTSHRGNLCFQNKACCSGRSMWLICSLVKMINGFAPSQEGKALLLGNCHPAANCQWAVKVNTCPPSLQAAHWLVIAIAGCCGLSHGWSLWVPTFWDQSEQRYIHLTDTLPSFFLKRHALLVFESWIHLRVSRTSWWSLGEQQALLCVSSVGGLEKQQCFLVLASTVESPLMFHQGPRRHMGISPNLAVSQFTATATERSEAVGPLIYLSATLLMKLVSSH